MSTRNLLATIGGRSDQDCGIRRRALEAAGLRMGDHERQRFIDFGELQNTKAGWQLYQIWQEEQWQNARQHAFG